MTEAVSIVLAIAVVALGAWVAVTIKRRADDPTTTTSSDHTRRLRDEGGWGQSGPPI
jgi:hypothetical protein